MTIYQAMRDINKLLNMGITEISKSDFEKIGWNTDNDTKEILEYLGCDVIKVHDLFNVKLPDKKFSKNDLDKQKFIEKHYNY